MIEFCKYHPILPATHSCASCHVNTCDECSNNDNSSNNYSCYICQRSLDELEVRNDILPFWRRLQESFKYPMNTNSIIIIIGVAILTTVSNYIPSIFSLIWYLLLIGILFKYCFSCLEKTSNGLMEAPDVTDGYGGGFGLIFQLVIMVVVIYLAIWGSEFLLGTMVASIVGIFMIAALPAMMINFALTESLVEALNPLNTIKLMTSIGLPYGLLLAFIMIMTASISVINQLIGAELSKVSTILQSSVSNYYTIVIFHIMGYMIYQYHKELGFEVINNNGEYKDLKSELQKNLTLIDILIKEGKVEEAINLHGKLIDLFPNDKGIKSNYFELLLATKNTHGLNDYATKYLDYMFKENRLDQIPITYKIILKINPIFKPNNPELRLRIASLCSQKGDSKSVIKLINGLHKEFPDFKQLTNAYELMASALDQLPNMNSQANACRKLIKRISQINNSESL